MNCNAAAINRSYDAPVLAGTFRFFIGLILAFVGLYIATFTDIQGHALGLLMVFGAPFVILTDGKS